MVDELQVFSTLIMRQTRQDRKEKEIEIGKNKSTDTCSSNPAREQKADVSVSQAVKQSPQATTAIRAAMMAKADCFKTVAEEGT